jgi:uncharacterized OB-fold protein
MSTTHEPVPDSTGDETAPVADALLTSELAAWRCLRCGAVCCVPHAQPTVCSRCGARYVLHA